MSTTVKTGWLKDSNGEKFAPKTLSSQVQTSDGILFEDKIQTDLDTMKSDILNNVSIEVDDALSSTSTNPVQNRVINEKFDVVTSAMDAAMDTLNASINTKLNASDAATTYETKEDAQTKLDEVTSYVDSVASGKADSSHSHTIANVTNLQSELDTINSEMDGSIKSLSASGTTITYTKNDGTTGTVTTDDTQVTNALATGIKAYVTGTTSATTNTGTQVFDTGVYLDTTAGQLVATTFKGNLDGNATTATNAVNAESATSATSATSAVQDASGNVITSTYETKTDASSKLTEAKNYADSIKNDLLNGAGTAYDTLKELGDLIDDNTDAIDALEVVAAGKQNTITGGASTITSDNLTTSRTLISDSNGKVAVSDVTSTELGYLTGVTSNVQTQLNDKAASSHTHDDRYYTETEVNDAIANSKNTWYGTCPTAANTAAKVVTTSTGNFSLTTGNIVYVLFTYAAYNNATLNVDGTGAIAIKSYGATNVTAYQWAANEAIGFVYDGTYFRMLDGMIASTTYYGMTKLSNSTSSTSTVLAATPSAVKSAYDLANTANTAVTNLQTDVGTLSSEIADLKASTENWTFTLEDGSTVTKAVYVG